MDRILWQHEPFWESVSDIVSGRDSRRIRLVIGNGLRPYDDALSKDWNRCERCRVFSMLGYPPEQHYALWLLVNKKMVDVVVTTNYDCLLEATLAGRDGISTTVNPVLHDDCTAFTSYCAHKPRAHAPLVTILKIHGTFSAAVSESDMHVVVLPSHPVPPLCRGQWWHYGALSLASPGASFPSYRHFTDTNLAGDRSYFEELIKEADLLLTDKFKTAAILTLGFRGFYDFGNPENTRNEEMTPVILKALRAGTPVFVVLTSEQYGGGKSTLSHEARKVDPDCVFVGPPTQLIEICLALMNWTPRDFDENYLQWIRSEVFESEERIEEMFRDHVTTLRP